MPLLVVTQAASRALFHPLAMSAWAERQAHAAAMARAGLGSLRAAALGQVADHPEPARASGVPLAINVIADATRFAAFKEKTPAKPNPQSDEGALAQAEIAMLLLACFSSSV